MAKGYNVSIHNKIINEEKLKIYGANAKPALESVGGKHLVRGSNISKLEGIPPERCSILEFESVEVVWSFYNSDEYQAAKDKLEGKVDRVMFVIEGV